MGVQVVPVDGVPTWHPNANSDVLIWRGYVAVLALDPHFDDEDQRAVVFEFIGARLTTIGSPNDEDIVDHPLYRSGLKDVLWMGEVHGWKPRHRADRRFILRGKENVTDVTAQRLFVHRITGTTLEAASAVLSGRQPDQPARPTPERDGTATSGLVDAVAWWRVGLPGGQKVLADAATEALVAGLDGIVLAELAGLPSDENSFSVDTLVDKVEEELGLQNALAGDLEVFAARTMCRRLFAGTMTERELATWAHDRFAHRTVQEQEEFEWAGGKNGRGTDHELLHQLALIDEEWDEWEYAVRDSSEIRQRVRALAEQIVSL